MLYEGVFLRASMKFDRNYKTNVKLSLRLLKPLFVKTYLCLSLSMALQPFVGPWPLFSFLILYTIGRIHWTEDQTVVRPLPIHRTTQTQNKRTQTSVPRVGFEPTTQVLERAKTVHALGRAVTVTGCEGGGVKLRLTVGQSWCRAPSGAHDQILSVQWKLQSCQFGGALSDERSGSVFGLWRLMPE
jgi:hypothetical protein